MKSQSFSILGAVSAIVAALAMPLCVATAAAQATPAEDVQVLTRGPVHEAFAETVNFNPLPGIIVKATPPAAIEELPPEQQLEGDNVTWISGYWMWDDEPNDFIWISGIWRNLPPGRQWVPGYWSQTGDGQYQWTSGYWADSTTAEVTYIPTTPPRNIDAGPNTEAPSEDSSWIPGNWVWVDYRYAWRPGCWLPLRPNWTWVPSRYCWTHRGYVYVDGYWDYAVGCRGVLFAPVYFNRHLYDAPDYYYTPGIVVALDVFANHLFLRPRCGHYYFGDYYAPRYRDAGYYASYSWYGHHRGYDPIYAYQRWDHRHDRGWENRRHEDFNYFRDHEDARPPHTWAAMRDFHSERLNDGRNHLFATPLATLAKNPAQGQRFRPLDKDRREQFVAQNQEIKKFGQERRRTEARGIVAGADAKGRAPSEKLTRSPIIGRQADRFATNDAPPKRPEPRGTNIQLKPAGPGRNLAEVGDKNAVRRPGERLSPTNERTGDHAAATLDTPRQGTDLPPSGKGTGRDSGTTREKLPGSSVQQIPGHKAGLVPHGEVQPNPMTNPALSLKDQSTRKHDLPPKSQVSETPRRQQQLEPQAKSQPQPQIRQLPQPKVQATPPRDYQPKAQVMPQPKSQPQVVPHVKSQPQPQIRQLPQPKVQAAPPRDYQPKAQVMPQRQSQPQPQIRQLPQPKVQAMPQRDYQPKAQVRELPRSQPQVMPQRQSQPPPQIRQLPQPKVQAMPQPQGPSSRQSSSDDSRDKKKDRYGH